MSPEYTISIESEDRGGKPQFFVIGVDHIDNSRTVLHNSPSRYMALDYAKMLVKAQNDKQPGSTILGE